MTDSAFVKHRAEALEDCGIGFGGVFGNIRADLTRKSYSNFNRVIRRAFKEEDEYLEGDDFMCNSLVNKVGDESRGRMTDNLLSCKR